MTYSNYNKSNIRNLAILEQYLTVIEPELEKVAQDIDEKTVSQV
ncbi:hypothetical protein [Fischerella sp.]|nr:hypothetical protein [Fischerella sp.]